MEGKRLGALYVDTDIETNLALYTAPADEEVIVSAVHFLNQSSTTDAYIRLAQIVSGETSPPANKDFILYNTLVRPKRYASVVLGVGLASEDALYIYSDLGNISCSAWGMIGQYGVSRLGAVDISAVDTATSLYAVPAGKQAVINSIIATNRGTSDATITIAHVASPDTTPDNKDFIFIDELIGAYRNLTIQNGICMSAGDILFVYSSSADVNFAVWGKEANT